MGSSQAWSPHGKASLVLFGLSFTFVLFFVDTLSLFCILAIFYCCIFAFPYTKAVLHRFEDPRPLDPLGVASPQLGMQNNLKGYHVYEYSVVVSQITNHSEIVIGIFRRIGPF